MKYLFLLFVIACNSCFAEIKEIRYLSGTDNGHTVSWDFFCTAGRNSGKWSTIQVPSHWEQQGFGLYNYGRDYKTYGRNFRFADEQGLYRHSFGVPISWKTKRVFIVFEGSMTDTEVKINGKLAGQKHQGAFYRFKYEITDKIDFAGENVLDVVVSKMSADESVNNAERLADYWIFGGIFRPVYLEAVPQEFVDHVSIDAKADGHFSMNVFPDGSKAGQELVANIFDPQGKLVATTAKPVTGSIVQLGMFVKDPLQWTAETPALYKVDIYLKEGSRFLYRMSEKFGFRTIEIRRKDGIYLNGVKIKMKGVNRHVWWPETGRCVNPEIDVMDVKLIKEMNMNAVRCSHYPPDQSFLSACDSLGLFVLDELAGWQKAYSTKAGAPLVREMVIRDANHPSVIFWSNGNEGGHNIELDDDYGLYDLSNRPVIHAHHRPGNAFNGIDCNHYEDYYSTRKILTDTNIYMVTEFLHAQDDGGGGAALNEFWELHWKSKLGAGGFIWDFADEGLVRTDLNNIIDVNGVNAPDGILGPHREREGSFNAIREIYSPVKIFMKDLPAGFDGTIPVENRYHFTNLSQCRFHWAVLNYRKPDDVFPGYDILKSGLVQQPDIMPNGGTGALKIPLPADWKDYDALILSAVDPFGNLLYKWTWNIKSPEQLLAGILTLKDTSSAVSSLETDSTVMLKTGQVSVVLNKQTGELVSVRSTTGDPLSFSGGPVLVSGNAIATGVKTYKENGAAIAELRYKGDMEYVKWKVYPSGWVGLEYAYELHGLFPFAGISFTYPENFVLGAKWLGKGPYRVWKNRLQGVTDNVWKNAYNNTQAGSSPWTFPEFKGYFADIRWMEINTVEGRFVVATPDSALYLRLFDFYALSGVTPHPALPLGNFSFLDAIPPTGTKLALNINANTAQLGPQSELNKIDGTTHRTLYFYFGLPKPSVEKRQFTMPAVNDLF